jgi:DNA polymerase
MPRYVVDIETTSTCDLPSCGAEKYARDHSTWILCIAWDDADSPFPDGPKLWRCDRSPGLHGIFDTLLGADLLIAHNAQFERSVIGQLCPMLKAAHRWADSAMLCGAAGRPHALRDACYSLCMPDSLEKDARGKRLLNMFSIQSSKLYVGAPSANPQAFGELCEYCRQDVRAEGAVWRALAPRFYDSLLRRQWVMDCAVNDTGIPIDEDEIRGAKAIYEYLQEEAECAASELTGGVSLRSTPALRDWTAANGYALDSFARGAVDEALANRTACDGAPEVERLLRLRKAVAGTAGKKFAAFIDRMCDDGRIRGALMARVAHTGRYAGRGIQPQNLPRGFMDAGLLPLIRDAARAGVSDLRGAVETLRLVADGQECDALAGLCRDAICAPDGKVFVVADYSAVEARVLAWLAGERWVNDIFRGDGKIYERTAAAMYKKSAESISKHERMAGKIATLALGYGGGVGALQRFASAYGITWSDEEAGEIVRSWRNSRPATMNFWKAVETAFRDAMRNGRALCKLGARACEVKADTIAGRPVIIFRLPSGRALIYWDPQTDVENGEIAVETYGAGNSLMPARAKGAKMSRLYGGILAENITQAVAFDLLLGSLLAISEKHADKCQIVMHIHDEIVVECAEAIAPTVAAAVRGAMEKTPAWAPGLRLIAEPEIMRRYRK